jgi:hypothetical protein
MPFGTTSPELGSPWGAFLSDVDRLLPRQVELHCLGGFVIAVCYHLLRPTSDVDYIEIIPSDAAQTLQHIAGPKSELAKKHGVYFQRVTVADRPESYAERATELFPGLFRNLRMFVLEPHDLALSKLTRNNPVDREDVAYLAKTVPLSPDVLRARYREELRPIIIGPPERHDRTLEMWIASFFGS